MDNLLQQCKLLSWNIRGLNNPAWQEDVKQVISTFRPDLICLQETKLPHISASIVRNSLGPLFENNFIFLPAANTRGYPVGS
jgi:exonuclease III